MLTVACRRRSTWLALASGNLAWDVALASGTVHASGQRASLEGLLPLRF